MLNMSWVDVRSQDTGDDGSTETAGRSNNNAGGDKGRRVKVVLSDYLLILFSMDSQTPLERKESKKKERVS